MSFLSHSGPGAFRRLAAAVTIAIAYSGLSVLRAVHAFVVSFVVSGSRANSPATEPFAWGVAHSVVATVCSKRLNASLYIPA